MSNDQVTEEAGEGDTEPESKPKIAEKLIALILENIGKVVTPVIASLFLFVLVTALLPFIKNALGITRVEQYLESMQEVLSSSEDTIFSYSYAFDLPTLEDEVAEVFEGIDITEDNADVASSIGIGSTPAVIILTSDDFSSNAAQLRSLVNNDDAWLRLLESRAELASTVTKNFFFSAAETSEVTLHYDLQCFKDSGDTINSDIAHQISINNQSFPARSGRNSVQGIYIDEEVLAQNQWTVSTSSAHTLRRHRLTAQFGSSRNTIGAATIPDAIALGATNCVFNAMIFVRDIPDPFERYDLRNMLENLTGIGASDAG